jgi:hypothetical protein
MWRDGEKVIVEVVVYGNECRLVWSSRVQVAQTILPENPNMTFIL